MVKPISEISKLNEQLRKLQEEYRRYQHLQEQSKYDYNHYNPASDTTYECHILACTEEISRNKNELIRLQNEIIDLRKVIKQKQRKLNERSKKR